MGPSVTVTELRYRLTPFFGSTPVVSFLVFWLNYSYLGPGRFWSPGQSAGSRIGSVSGLRAGIPASAIHRYSLGWQGHCPDHSQDGSCHAHHLREPLRANLLPCDPSFQDSNGPGLPLVSPP